MALSIMRSTSGEGAKYVLESLLQTFFQHAEIRVHRNPHRVVVWRLKGDPTVLGS